MCEKNIDINNISVLPIIRSLYPSLFSAEKKVADYILNNPDKIVNMSVSELAEKSEVSDATIVRFAQKIGYNGFYQMKINLASDLGYSNDENEKKNFSDTKSRFNLIMESTIKNIQNTFNNIDYDALEYCAKAINECDTLNFFATGNTIPIAMDAAFRFSRIGIKAFYFSTPELATTSASILNERDLAIGISHSGDSKLVISALELAKNMNAKTIAITNHMKTPVARVADKSIIVFADDSLFSNAFTTSKVCEMLVLDTLLSIVTSLRKNSTYRKIENLEKILSAFKV